MDPRNSRGPVIERANEPGIPRGLMRLFVVALFGGGAYYSGYIPDLSGFERQARDVIASVENYWSTPSKPSAQTPAPAPAPSQVARAPQPAPAKPPIAVAPPISRPTPPPVVVPAPPPTPDPFAEDFKRQIMGSLKKPPEPPTPAASTPAPPPVANNPPPAVEPPRTSLFPRPPGAQPAPFSPPAVDQIVERELNSFNASRDVPIKRAAIEKVLAAAQIGHGPSRGVIARGYPVSTIIRDMVSPGDAVRFALDFIVQKRAYSNDPRRDFMALAAWFDGERKDAVFGEAVFDAIRDDQRLQTPDAINDIMSLLYRAERGCVALRRHLNVFDPNTTNVGHCGQDLAAATAERARQAGASGGDAKRFQESVDKLKPLMAEPI